MGGWGLSQRSEPSFWKEPSNSNQPSGRVRGAHGTEASRPPLGPVGTRDALEQSPPTTGPAGSTEGQGRQQCTFNTP